MMSTVLSKKFFLRVGLLAATLWCLPAFWLLAQVPADFDNNPTPSADLLRDSLAGETQAGVIEEVVTTFGVEFDPTKLGIAVESIPNASIVVGDFVVGPGKIETQITPGRTQTFEMTITNRTGIDRRFNIEIEDMTGSADGKDSIILLGDDRGPYSIKDYIQLPATSFDLKQGQRARVPVKIAIPADAEPGGFYGSVLVNTVSIEGENNQVNGSAVARSPIIQRVGVLFFVTVPGEAMYEGELVDFSMVPKKSWIEKGPVNFVITYENTGVVHLNPYGELRITNMFDEEIGFVELEPWFALPKSVRLREITWNRDLLYGKYTATLYLNRGYDDIIDQRSITFWVIPWKFILAGFGVVFICFLLIRSFFRTFEFKRKGN